MSDIKANVAAVLRRIEAAAERAGRSPKEITLVAVTKTHPAQTVIDAYQAGLRHFGENRVFETKKIAQVSEWLATQADQTAPTWHFIGHLQSRQVGDVLGVYDLIHSVDSLKLAQRINRLAQRDGYPAVPVLLQCNVSGEGAKSGFELAAWQTKEQQLTSFVEQIDLMAGLEKIKIRGLMTMAPIVDDAEETRPVFNKMAGLTRILQRKRPEIDWETLSMGMTDDFEVAIEEGATMIRVGRALFGERRT